MSRFVIDTATHSVRLEHFARVLRKATGYTSLPAAIERVLDGQPQTIAAINPDNDDEVERLYALIDEAQNATVNEPDLDTWLRGAVRTGLRRYAAGEQPTEPLAEPFGLGALISHPPSGRLFVRVASDGREAKWLLVDAPIGADPRFVWSAIPADVILLFAGVDQ